MVRRFRFNAGSLLLLTGICAVTACSSNHGWDSNGGAADATLPVAPKWATPANYVGPMEPSTPIKLQVHLAMRDTANAEAELAAISDPDGARYGQFLSDEDFTTRYAPTANDVTAIKAHVESFGLTVTYVADNRAFIEVAGTAEQAGKAFATQLGNYQVQKELRYAPTDRVHVPSAIGARIGAVLGLSTPVKVGTRMKRGAIALKSVQAKGTHQDGVAPNTCSEWFGQIPDTTDPAYGSGFPALTYVPCGLVPAKLRQAYGVDAAVRRGNDGRGIKVAIVDAWQSPTLLADAQTYAAQHDADYPLAASQFTVVPVPGTPVSPPDTGWYGEQTLDVESVHAIAPGAHIMYVGANSNNDPDLLSALNTSSR